MNYKEQDKEIQKLLKRISIKSKNFAKANSKPGNSQYYEDLLAVKNDLLDADNFLHNEYLK